jgi:predicted kinase
MLRRTVTKSIPYRPAVLIVTGSPATGKTTLAVKLGSELRLPVLSKDLFKGALLESLGAASLSESQKLGRAAFTMLYAAATELVGAGVSLILEAPFRSGVSEPSLTALTHRAAAAVIVCTASSEVVVRRFRQRASSSERHPGHMDRIRPEMSRAIAFDPPDLGLPAVVVNTSDGYQPPLQELIEWISQHLPPGSAKR